MSKRDWKLVEDFPVSEYKCGLKAGRYLRLKKDIHVRYQATGHPTGDVHSAGRIWQVLRGTSEEPHVVWLRQPDGHSHTWEDNDSIFETFELLEDEVFDVVNERDEVIGRETRREVHRLGLKHRAVHVLVFNRRGEVFLQKRSMSKDTFPGAWDSSASGHLNAGEDYDACAVRELAEEIGLKLERGPARLFKIDACAETGQEFVWVYRCESDGPFELNPDEIADGKWFAPEAVTRWIAERPSEFASALLYIWKKLAES